MARFARVISPENPEGIDVPYTAEEEALADAEAAQSAIDLVEYNKQEYARNRHGEYPSIPDQLDEIYHNGIDSWKAVIKVTKDKYPKG